MLKEQVVVVATEVLLKEVPKYMVSNDKYALTKFMNSKLTLEQIGICNGVAKLIDEKLQKVHPYICIVSTDTVIKFQNDIHNYLDREFVVPHKPLNKKKR